MSPAEIKHALPRRYVRVTLIEEAPDGLGTNERSFWSIGWFGKWDAVINTISISPDIQNAT
jgi:hypothetical protein